MAQELRSTKAKKTPPELCFDTITYIDCSAWESRRVMQRKIAEELKLDPEIMAMFDKQDEEDDFKDLYHDSRDTVSELTHSQFRSLLHEEAADIAARQSWMQSIDQTMVIECCLYELFLQYSFHSATELDWVSHAPNYWMCDGIIKGDGTRKISDTLHQEIRWELGDSFLGSSMFEKLMEDLKAPFLVINDDVSFFEKRPFRWICVTSKNLPIQEDTKAILERASSVFVALEKSDNPQGLPNGLLTHCSNLSVLVLYYCAFNFISPPFLQCRGLRFLGLDHCTHDNTSEGENYTNWVCLQSLWVLDLRYTEWGDI
ncbi:uncharacterized protein LOC111255667 [Setaria italica]|uniref:uncharacterized protein LOC111255667 n=1 Tax=Setaria italica TaxID=4555 RepID=UPI000BE602E6|nr:uncharacterized protein LOC111255667 [Setaria italica]